MDVEQAAIQATVPDDGADTTFSIRVTRHGKIRVWVKKALEFFQVNPETPLVLYSGPSDASASAIPKLISVVEIIKRQYLEGHLVGLHQFNQLLFEERSQVPVEGENRASALLLALEGSSHPKQKLAPYMKITLCTKSVPERHGERETYQTPNVRKLSKAAKAKMRQRAKRGANS
ncbi:hypothetical protein BKA82DRAFT_991732 [Pisolithus tinctorius]|uniref:DNA/RNA-binding protein Alba-like domain-containing protein n=1 Tax=Pisolithus tinctorius Marx 270 TaxID=870435 RepID=A0A0C3K0V4_PISTI|nr:hypothetical protein BKA82DRAFT_991732 [Pisolithus tinctorius]KIO15033.1 hypothetical protein M404DRAFT_991732 [Pisolithus tinctorius Marx 270]